MYPTRKRKKNPFEICEILFATSTLNLNLCGSVFLFVAHIQISFPSLIRIRSDCDLEVSFIFPTAFFKKVVDFFSLEYIYTYIHDFILKQ